VLDLETRQTTRGLRYCVWIYSKLESKTETVEAPPRQNANIKNLGSTGIALEDLGTQANEGAFREGKQFPPR